jgi:glutaminyl-peptide cyclotransferase
MNVVIRSYRNLFSLFLFLVGFVFLICLILPCQAELKQLIPLVIRKIPHDSKAFTQGLAIDQNQLYESTGLYGESSLRLIDLHDGHVNQIYRLPSQFFAEGLAVFDHQLIQLTWREKQAFIYQRYPFQLHHSLAYQGEGWGLCRDQQSLWMSDGTSTLVQRNAKNFAILKKLNVFLNGQLLPALNDLECVDQSIYANVWGKEWIVKIDKQTGEVESLIDASQLLTSFEKMFLSQQSVLNGIAFCPATQTFYLTGKNWPWIFEVQFVPKVAKN